MPPYRRKHMNRKAHIIIRYMLPNNMSNKMEQTNKLSMMIPTLPNIHNELHKKEML